MNTGVALIRHSRNARYYLLPAGGRPRVPMWGLASQKLDDRVDARRRYEGTEVSGESHACASRAGDVVFLGEKNATAVSVPQQHNAECGSTGQGKRLNEITQEATPVCQRAERPTHRVWGFQAPGGESGQRCYTVTEASE